MLTDALQDLVRHSPGDGLRIDLRVEGAESVYAEPSLLALYRVAQESLTNVQRHSQADRAEITLRMGDETAVLTVEDNGKGFDVPQNWEASKDHYGLRGMEERVQLVGGRLTIRSSGHTGTRLEVVIPRQPLHSSEGVS